MKLSDQPKWKVVENVVAAIERSLNGIQGGKVIANASVQERFSAIPRQVDVCVDNSDWAESPPGRRRSSRQRGGT